MKDRELTDYESTDYLVEGHPSVLEQVRPIVSELLEKLKALPDGSSEQQRLQAFEDALKKINAFENDIETVERETILGAIYHIGSIVGLDPDSQFADRWRGDW